MQRGQCIFNVCNKASQSHNSRAFASCPQPDASFKQFFNAPEPTTDHKNMQSNRDDLRLVSTAISNALQGMEKMIGKDYWKHCAGDIVLAFRNGMEKYEMRLMT